MAFPNDDPIVHQGDRTLQLIDWLVGRLEECQGEVLPLETDDLLKQFAKNARNNMASAIEQLRLARAKKEQQLGEHTS
jgi:phage terminase Nu1 subunit (DNA packaging protein)